MNPLRIFKRLRELERSAAGATSDCVWLAGLAREDRASIRPMFRALHRRLHAIESHTTSCARCGAKLDISIQRDDGPIVVEALVKGVNGSPVQKRLVVCWYCEAAARRMGWKRVKPEAIAKEAAE